MFLEGDQVNVTTTIRDDLMIAGVNAGKCNQLVVGPVFVVMGCPFIPYFDGDHKGVE